jgi:cell division protein FtsQ
MLSSFGIVKKVTSRETFDINQLEEKLLSHPAVKTAQVFFVNNGKLIVKIQKRTPIGRVISTAAEKNFYLDTDGFLMPLCSTYVAKVPLFSGDIGLPETLNIYSRSKLNKLPIIQTIYKMSQLINNDSFLKSQIVQIHINNNGYFELIPRIGNQRILFGMRDNMEKKFKKLKCFYTNGPAPKELNLYDTLNIMYNNQIICSKRI